MLLLTLLALVSSATASQLQIRLKDNTQQALSNVVVELTPHDAAVLEVIQQHETALTNAKIMKQIDQQFVPHILPVQKGTTVEFPDTDTVQHHVYSFSPTKVFEIAIYKEELKRQIMFDQAGVVELGCNIHDWMLGYIYVADSPLFAQTDVNGEVSFSLPFGAYDIKVWHPRIQQSDIDTSRSINFQDTGSKPTTAYTIVLSADILPSYTEFDDVHGLSEY
jgi:plastocyanin